MLEARCPTLYSNIYSLWSVATTRVGIWTWIWSTTLCQLGQEMACCFQCWKNTTCWKKTTLLEEKPCFKILGLYFSSILNWGSYIICITWFILWSFILLSLLCISINLPHILTWNTVVSRLMLLAATWKY